MPKKPSLGQYTLTPEQARAIVKPRVIPFLDGDSTIADFLLLLRALVYEPDREDLLVAVEKARMPYSQGACDALTGLIQERRQAWQKGAR